MAKIEFEDKVALIDNPDIPDINKVKADDMNEIKSVVNENAINISTQVDEDYRVNLLETKNLFDKDNANILVDLFISSSEDKIEGYSGTRSIYISIKPNTTYTISKSKGHTFRVGTSSVVPVLNTPLSDVVRDNTTSEITITSESTSRYLIAYIYVSGDTDSLDDILDTLQIEEGSTATTYEAFVPNQILVDNEKYTDTINVGSVVDSRSRVNVLYSKNLFDNSNLTNGYLNDNGTITTNTDFRVSDYINVSDMSKITISGNSGGSERICFYNSSKTFISTVNTSTNTTMAIDVPNNATYVRATIKATNLNIYTIQEGSSIITPSIYVDNEELYSKDNLEQYSTSEIRIGTWLGKPLYRKVIDFGALPNNANKSVNSNISNLSEVIKVYASARRSDKTAVLIPYTLGNESIGIYYGNDNTVHIVTSTDRSAFTCQVIVEYTKTTD